MLLPCPPSGIGTLTVNVPPPESAAVVITAEGCASAAAALAIAADRSAWRVWALAGAVAVAREKVKVGCTVYVDAWR